MNCRCGHSKGSHISDACLTIVTNLDGIKGTLCQCEGFKEKKIVMPEPCSCGEEYCLCHLCLSVQQAQDSNSLLK